MTICLIDVGRGIIFKSLCLALEKCCKQPNKIFLVEKNFSCKFALEELMSNCEICIPYASKTKLFNKEAREITLEDIAPNKIDLMCFDIRASFGCNSLLPEVIIDTQQYLL